VDGPGSFPEIVEIVVEIPRGSRNKETEVLGWREAEDARRLLLADRERFRAETAGRSTPR
jgi:hypothetical protein